MSARLVPLVPCVEEQPTLSDYLGGVVLMLNLSGERDRPGTIRLYPEYEPVDTGLLFTSAQAREVAYALIDAAAREDRRREH
jgi:hypothetical protein